MDSEVKRFLLTPHSYGPGVTGVRHIETHISDIFLAADTAYKFKKAVRLPFLDFRSRSVRQAMCERELELNRRYAPTLYGGIIAIGLEGGEYNIEGRGEIVEYGLKMRRFSDDDLWSKRAIRRALTPNDIGALICRVAAFHRLANIRPEWGNFTTIRQQILQNIAEIPRHHRARLIEDLTGRLEYELERHHALIESRRTTHVRAIHGDLHLNNITFLDNEPTPFDGIEFSTELGSGDVWSDIGFLTMDLSAHGLRELATLAINLYLEESDDFAGLPLLSLYSAHRALIRAKIHLIAGADAEDHTLVDRYLDTASESLTHPPSRIIAIGGLSGSGKTTLARAIATRLGGIVVRTDVVRKHILGLRPLETAPESAYTEAVSQAVYRGLSERARNALPRGGVIVLDGVHREPYQREMSEQVALEYDIPFCGIWCVVPKEVALQRVCKRTNDASNAHRGVVERQYTAPPQPEHWYTLDTSGDLEWSVEAVLRYLHRTACERDHFGRSVLSPP